MPPLGNSLSLDLSLASFKQRKRLDSRIHEVTRVRNRFPCKIPVIVERDHREKLLPALQKIKFLVPQEMTLGQFVTMIRCRLPLSPSLALCVLVSGRRLASLTMTMSQVYSANHDQDGFLYMTYMSQDMFG
ncbi:microtubule-associated protein 1 light chain 3 gamma-like [Ascaphus truei]|uniref:microtubule-associated protein 1 light chain 3 gamma-like n=1 Tax=Ascaphus truei TaxID=8439 RepID=UPI003F59EC9C